MRTPRESDPPVPMPLAVAVSPEFAAAAIAWATPRLEHRSPSCVVCGAPIGGEHSYLAELGHYDSTAHTQCVDWSMRPFPFDGLVTALVRCRRSAVGKAKGEWFALSRRLWLLHKDWPQGCPENVRHIRALEGEARLLARTQKLSEKLQALI